MARIVAIDYGTKRVGLAVTDNLQIIARGLTTVPGAKVMDYLKNYCLKEEVECFVVGLPRGLNAAGTQASAGADNFCKQLAKIFPQLPIHRVDERFTSKMAAATMLASGLKKMARRNKELIDEISATIILQSFMEQRDARA